MGASIFSLFFFLSLYLQQVNGYSPLRAGLAFLPIGLATLGAALLAARFVARLGVRRQLVFGLCWRPGLAWMAQLAPGDGFWPSLFWPELLAGTGFGLSFVPMTLARHDRDPAAPGWPRIRLAQHHPPVGRRHRAGGAAAIAATVHPHSQPRTRWPPP